MLKFWKFALMAAAITKPLHAQRAGTIQVRWLGHAAFEIVSPGGTRLMIDPWLGQNPATPDSLKPISRWTGADKPAAILVSHSHYDHAGDAKALALATGAPVISVFELVASMQLPEKQTLGGNVGGAFKIGDVTVNLVPAVHSSDPGGRPLGFVIRFADGRTLYHTGDTWIFGDMALIQERFHPDIILLNTGGGPYTEDPATAALAIKKYFKPKVIVPMHFGTGPAFAQEADVRAAFRGNKALVVMKPGETRRF
jgi:L-ascorbate metabolism protein UlaG (beta-lactamase superfamily)